MIHVAVMMTIMMMMAIYLLVSKRNAFGSELITDQRLRRKAGWTLLITVLVYLANVPFVLWNIDDLQLLQITSETLDMAISYPVLTSFMLELLQDRRRWDNRLWWLSALVVMPMVGWLLTGETWWTWIAYGMFVTEMAVFVIWYFKASIEYHRFLIDNYADLEHKEVVWSWSIMGCMALSIVNYLLTLNNSDIHMAIPYSYAMHAADTLFIGIIVWYIDHQQVLEPLTEETDEEKDTAVSQEDVAQQTAVSLKTAVSQDTAEEPQKRQEAESMETTNSQEAHPTKEDIIIIKTGTLLQRHCEETQLYLQHDLSLKTLTKACNTNRTYLSQYFASQGTTYYIYINKLRIDHFQALYRKALEEGITSPKLQQLSFDSGFASYNTFSRAFVSCTGISVRKWMEKVGQGKTNL